jgi:hypothetical protein
MLNDARIRLEGRLEQLERATAAIEGSMASLRNGEIGVVQCVLDDIGTPELREATERVREMSKTEPELRAALRRLDRARVALANAVRRLARARGVPAMPVQEQVKRLIAEPLLWEDTVKSDWAPFTLTVAGTAFMCLFTQAFTVHVWAAALVGSTVFVAAMAYLFRRTHIVLTRAALVVDDQAFPLEEIERVRFEPAIRSPMCRMVVRLRIGSVSVSLPEIPEGLPEALRSAGVGC